MNNLIDPEIINKIAPRSNKNKYTKTKFWNDEVKQSKFSNNNNVDLK